LLPDFQEGNRFSPIAPASKSILILLLFMVAMRATGPIA